MTTKKEIGLRIFDIEESIKKCQDEKSVSCILDDLVTGPLWERTNDIAKSIIASAVLKFTGVICEPCHAQNGFAAEHFTFARHVAGQFKFTRNLYAFSQTNAPVLILGESGTGKTLYAKAIHLLSTRRSKPFKSINCSAIPETLLESELFGYEKGSHNKASEQRKGLFEAVDGGTLFLDEIGDASLLTQVKLLTAIEDKKIRRVGGTDETKVDIRIIAATNKNLPEAIKGGQFREDLFYRLKTFVIRIPSLREQLRVWSSIENDEMEENSNDNLCLHLDSVIGMFYKKKYLSKKKASLSDAAMTILMGYAFPGNFRELDQIFNYAMTVDQDDIIGLDDLPEEVISATSGLNNSQTTVTVADDFPVLQYSFHEAQRKDGEFIEHYKQNDSFARKKIIAELELADGNVRLVARKLGVSYETLYTQIKRDYGINVKAMRAAKRKRSTV